MADRDIPAVKDVEERVLARAKMAVAELNKALMDIAQLNIKADVHVMNLATSNDYGLARVDLKLMKEV